MNIIRKFLGLISGSEPEQSIEPAEPVVVPRGEHGISRKNIDPDALKVLNRLNRFDHTAYLVGGGVRDLLLGRAVKDFDIATSAHPHEIKKLFRNCRLIGRRFRLAHILFRGGKVIEVSTFRRHAGFGDDGNLLIQSDNTFGTAAEDARRRDFTVNGLFYNIADFKIIDYVGGLEDLEKKQIATIGDPEIRYLEDPIRILRAVRFAARLDFEICSPAVRAMERHRGEIWNAAVPRILEELLRMLQQGAAAASFSMLCDHKILRILLPRLAADCEHEEISEQVRRNLQSLDRLWSPKKAHSAAFVFAALYFPSYNALVQAESSVPDRTRLAAELLADDLKKLHFPRLQFERAKQLLAAQPRLEAVGRKRSRPAAFVKKVYFEEALALFELIRPSSRENRGIVRRWKSLQQRVEGSVPPGREEKERKPGRRRSRSRRRRRGAKTAPKEAAKAASPDSGS